MDVTDSCWLDVFGKEERDEIRGFRCVDIPDLSVEVDTYLNQLEDLDVSKLHERVDSGDFKMESDSKWIQKSYRDAFRLLKSDFFPIQNQTEGSVVKRVWSCVDTCYDFSTIKCVR